MNRILLAATLCISIVPVANASMSDDPYLQTASRDDYNYCRAYAEDRGALGYESYGGGGALAPIIDGLAGALGDAITGRDSSDDLGRAATGSIRGTARDVERRYTKYTGLHSRTNRTIDRLTERCLNDLDKRRRRETR